MKTKMTFVALGAVCLLSACGEAPKERATGGAAAGAATGAAVGALAGPPGMAVGALVGGGAGAATGATTSPQQVNLGQAAVDESGNTRANAAWISFARELGAHWQRFRQTE